MFGDLSRNTIMLVVNVESEYADGGALASIEIVSIERLPEYTTSEYATLIMPQIDERGIFFATLMIMFPAKMRPDIALQLSGDFFSGNGHSPGDLN